MKIAMMKLALIVFLLTYVLFLLSLYDSRRLLSAKTALIFLAGAVMFLFVSLIQNPLQMWIAKSSLMNRQNYVVGLILLALIAGFIQEFLKLVPVFYSRKDIFLGAVSGAGFGFVGAMLVIVPRYSYTLLGLFEWLIVIAFQISATALILYGFSKKKGIMFYVLISLLHAFAEGAVILQKMKPMILMYTVIFLFVITVPTFVISVKKYKNTLL